MKFQNTTGKALTFEIDTTHPYSCEANGVVDIPDRFAWAVSSMGLPLEEVAAKAEAPAPAAKPAAAQPEKFPNK